MSIQVNVLEAKTQLSRLLDRAEAGEDVIIARAGGVLERDVAAFRERLGAAPCALLRLGHTSSRSR